LEYRFDRLLVEKLAQAYDLLVPDKHWPVGRSEEPISGVKTDSGCESRADLTGLPLQMFVVTLTSLLVMLKSACVDRPKI
jgi:hypothetical protein